MVVAAGSAIAARASAQTAATPAPVPPANPDFAQQARDSVQRNHDALAKFDIPMATEPAFQFKA
jgi:hypothetical protein